MAPVIRPLQNQDKVAWQKLWRAYLAFYETTLDQSIYDTTFARLTSPDHPHQNAFIALQNDHAVGLVHYIYHAHNWRSENVTYLQDLFADPTARGQGIGRALIQAVYDAADANGTPTVYWLTQDFNAPARQLYDRIATLTPFVKYSR